VLKYTRVKGDCGDENRLNYICNHDWIKILISTKNKIVEVVSIMKKFLLVIILMNINLVFAQAAELLFKSGFSSSSSIYSQHSPFHYWTLQNTDAQSGYDWTDGIDAIPETRSTILGGLYGNFDNTLSTNCVAEITTDPDDAGNQVLHYEHYTAPVGSARLSAALMYNLSGDNMFQQGYIKYRMRLSEGIGEIENISNTVDWLMLTELWEYDQSRNQHARWNFHIYKDWGVGEKLYWAILMQEYQPTRRLIWTEENRAVSVPVDEWFTFEMFFKRGDADNGSIWIAITPDGQPRQVLFDITNYTQHTTDPQILADWAVFKLYTIQWLVEMMNKKGTPLGIHYDDFEYWDDIPGTLPPRPPENLRLKEN
jgi:hypothetical protein